MEASECQRIDKPPADWALAKALFMKGMATKEICQQAHVSLPAIWARMSREGWTKLRAQSGAIVQVTVETKKTAPEEMRNPDSQQTSNLLHGRLLKRLERITEGWDSGERPKSLIGQSQALQLLEKATDIGKTLCGWGQSSTTSVMSIATLQSQASWTEPNSLSEEKTTAIPESTAGDSSSYATQPMSEDVPGSVTER